MDPELIRASEAFAHLAIEWPAYTQAFASIRNARTRSIAMRLNAAVLEWMTQPASIPSLDSLVSALNCPGSTVPIAACFALGPIAAETNDPVGFAAEAFRRSTSPARAWMMRFLHSTPQAERTLVEAALCDKSKRVREWACEGAEARGYSDLIPMLEGLSTTDPADNVREAAARSADLLRDGYSASRDGDDWTISIRESPKSLSIEVVSQTVIDRLGIAQTIELLRTNPTDPRLGMADQPRVAGRVLG